MRGLLSGIFTMILLPSDSDDSQWTTGALAFISGFTTAQVAPLLMMRFNFSLGLLELPLCAFLGYAIETGLQEALKQPNHLPRRPDRGLGIV